MNEWRWHVGRGIGAVISYEMIDYTNTLIDLNLFKLSLDR